MAEVGGRTTPDGGAGVERQESGRVSLASLASAYGYEAAAGIPEGFARRRLRRRVLVAGAAAVVAAAAGAGAAAAVLGTDALAWAVPCAVVLACAATFVAVRSDTLGWRGAVLLFTAARAGHDYKKAGRREARAKRAWLLPEDQWLHFQQPLYEGVPPDVEERCQEEKDAVHLRNARRLRDVARRVKGLWIKLCQYLASRTDVVDPAYTRTLSCFEDAEEPRPFNETMHTIRESIGDAAVTDVVEPPLSVASIGSVYRATLRGSGERVVVKVLHKGIGRMLLLDADVMLYLTEQAAAAKPQWDFRPVLQEWIRETPQEVDFRIEARNLAAVDAGLRRVANLPDPFGFRYTMPRVMRPHVSRAALVLSFEDGARLRAFAAAPPAGVDPLRVARDIIRITSVQLFVEGVFNADPHPGNFLVRADGTPVLLDFGLCKRISDDTRRALARTVVAAADWDEAACARAFEDVGLKLRQKWLPLVPGVRWGWDTAAAKAKVGKFQKENAEASSPEQRKAHHEQQRVIQKEGMWESIPPDITLYYRALDLMRGVATLLGWQGSLLHVAVPFARAGARGGHPSDAEAAAEEERQAAQRSRKEELGALIEQTKPLLLAMLNADRRLLGLVRCHAAAVASQRGAPDATEAEATDIDVQHVTVRIAGSGGPRTVKVRLPLTADLSGWQGAMAEMFVEAGEPKEPDEATRMAIMQQCFKFPDHFRDLELARARAAERRAAGGGGGKGDAGAAPEAEPAPPGTVPAADPVVKDVEAAS